MESYAITAALDHDHDGATETPEGERLPALLGVAVPVNLIEAGLACASTDETKPYLQGVYLHRIDGVGRIAATDGHRLFVASFPLPEDAPEWLDAGAIIPAGLLKARLGLICKAHDTSAVRVAYAAGAPKLEISDALGDTVFRVMPIDGEFPDYRNIIGTSVGGFAADQRGEFEPVAFNGEYLKACGALAKILAAQSVQVFAGKPSDPAILTFAGVPGAVLYLMPMRAEETLSLQTAAILSPAIKATIGALRAHKTRNEKAAKKARTKAEREYLLAQAADFAERIKAVMARTSPAALPAPDAADANEPTDANEPASAGDDAPAEPAAPAEPETADATAAPEPAAPQPETTAKARRPRKAKADKPAKARNAAKADKPAKANKPARGKRHAARKANGAADATVH